MGLRPDGEIEASFRRVERLLDAMLGEAAAFLEQEGIDVQDATNRSGFDQGGFPSFVWAYDFNRRRPFGCEIKQASVGLWYREPVYDDDTQSMEVTSVAQIFQIGKLSRVSESQKQIHPISDFLKMKIDEVIRHGFAYVDHVFANY